MNELRKLAELYGIETNYYDIHGSHIQIEDEVLVNLLGSFGEYPQIVQVGWKTSIERKKK